MLKWGLFICHMKVQRIFFIVRNGKISFTVYRCNRLGLNISVSRKDQSIGVFRVLTYKTHFNRNIRFSINCIVHLLIYCSIFPALTITHVCMHIPHLLWNIFHFTSCRNKLSFICFRILYHARDSFLT